MGIRDECLRRGFVAVTRWLWSSVVVLWCSWFVVGTVLCWLLFVVVVVVFVAVFRGGGKRALHSGFLSCCLLFCTLVLLP